MKKSILVIAVILMPGLSGATMVMPQGFQAIQAPALPPSLSAYSKTATLEWGCPVADTVVASTQAEAVQKIRTECVEQVSKAASKKPGVMNVLDTRVVYPDIQVSELTDGFHLEGTFFLETVVLQRSKPGEQ